MVLQPFFCYISITVNKLVKNVLSNLSRGFKDLSVRLDLKVSLPPVKDPNHPEMKAIFSGT